MYSGSSGSFQRVSSQCSLLGVAYVRRVANLDSRLALGLGRLLLLGLVLSDWEVLRRCAFRRLERIDLFGRHDGMERVERLTNVAIEKFVNSHTSGWPVRWRGWRGTRQVGSTELESRDTLNFEATTSRVIHTAW